MSAISFDNTYARLSPQFFSKQLPSPVASPKLIRANQEFAEQLGIDAAWLNTEIALQCLAGNELAPGSDPIATIYAGHQFGGWNPQLGDGRAVLLGEVVGKDGHRYDIQLKGAGRTPYSRGGDGRSPLGPVLREYILCEAMAAFGVPTTRSLAAVSTGESVIREMALPGAIFTRVASSHIRIGTFQFFSARQDVESIRTLFEYSARRHFPDTLASENPVLSFLDAVIDRQAALVASWQLLGFIHGVMNTDNMLICGETVDYGPCAFMDGFDPNAVFSSIDHQGRYAYSNQPKIAHWNLSWLAQALMPLIDKDQEKAMQGAQHAIDRFSQKYQLAYEAGLANKLGFSRVSADTRELGDRLLELMAKESMDFTGGFRKLTDCSGPDSTAEIPDELFQFPESFDSWLCDWKSRLDQTEPDQETRLTRMRSANPVFIPRNHLVEEAIQAAQNDNDFVPFNALVDLLANPYVYDPEKGRYAQPPADSDRVYQTFCGT